MVLTSPNRDDLPDEGSTHYFNVVTAIKARFPEVKVEVLIPDFKGKKTPLETVINANPDVINHNIETVPSLYRTVRKGSLYKRSYPAHWHLAEEVFQTQRYKIHNFGYRSCPKS